MALKISYRQYFAALKAAFHEDPMHHPSAIVQNADEVISPANMDEITKDSKGQTGNLLLVRSVFMTWQGEAPFSGQRALFIRLGGCNRGPKVGEYGCAGCDTDFEVSKSTRLSQDGLNAVCLDTLRKFGHFETANSRAPLLIVITGGEPLLQAPALIQMLPGLIESLRFRMPLAAITVQFETNGDLLPHFRVLMSRVGGHPGANALRNALDIHAVKLAIVCSPKHPGKVAHFPNKFLSDLDFVSSVSVRLVVTSDTSSPYNSIPQPLLDWAASRQHKLNQPGDPRPLYLSPMTVHHRPVGGDIAGPEHIDHDATRANMVRTTGLAARHCLPLSLQTHVFLSVE